MTDRRDSVTQTYEADDEFFAPRRQSTVLYRDGFCTLTDDDIAINSYFFPGVAKHIPLTNIESAYTDRDLELPWYSKKVNGLSSDGATWWALDWRRAMPFVEETHEGVLLQVKDDWLRKGFSVEDTHRFMPLLRRAVDRARENQRRNSSTSI
ncbi:hypothetical protein THASP1DRAFT_27944 [Thamnocephalis sphaerospora]|uniref:Uncharacterized protein n=1 Tax=Thamnocephalis sphaerospora TaxID=78915 RepID=A0A4V1IX93_9FUNG|nr:hypothetical protein THASP1DRAFT_27944 [Thamnocephalis sphaerospora]|eukprot:RKP10259.1 hypothetical protein THASP1DRAFT_27944 [Thamnocephalis sphaerospora]